MGFLDPTKRKIIHKKEEIHRDFDRGLHQVQQGIDQRIAEVRSYWQSKFGLLTNLFNQNPKYQHEYGTPQEFIMGEEFEQFSLNMFSDFE